MPGVTRFFGRAVLLLAALTLVAGCATTQSVQNARGEGIKRLFPYDLDAVHAAVLAAARARDLAVVEGDRTSGQYVFASAMSWRSFGERIAVFVRTLSPRLTEVEVVSKPVLTPLNFPRDWELVVLNEIDSSLRGAVRGAEKP